MKLVRKMSLFHRAVVEMTEEEHKAYKLGHQFGMFHGFGIGVLVTVIIAFIILS